MGAGRFVCVALPFGLTLASLVCILMVMLAGITNKNLDLFEVKTQNLSISSNSLANLENELRRRAMSDLTITALEGSASSAGSSTTHTTDLTTAAIENSFSSAVSSVTSGTNITAADLGLADSYKVNLFNYCYQTGSNTTCISAKFNWAKSALNVSTIEAMASTAAGVTVKLPKELTGSLKTFTVVSEWTQVVYIVAVLTCAVELVFGLIGFCSRCGSCLTFLISGLSTTTIIIASILATVQASIVTGAVEATAKAYKVKASIDTGFLAITWLAVAFSIAGGLFWTFTICCCAADHHKSSRRSRDSADREKLVPTGSYQPIADPNHNGFAGQQQGIYSGAPMNNRASRGNAYEPYAHTSI